ncbi:YodC family protein [Chryseobacterium rhizoplanae]|uniref:DUF2158 domain-containing protein n=1 Tax=Chryseobacterium rhizoplanae TaxID=1609531 RepID=UPI001CE267E2|nr:DUF2158 domain-containing protein [Chryseobacterium rhizoplanae]UCA60465.1 YodC family protein [Chryseobacterium rhizoplanae]
MEGILKRGDIVTLKSGSPIMTVKYKLQDGSWKCSLFDSNNELKEGTFTEEQLIISK